MRALQARVRALQRKMAKELAVVRLRGCPKSSASNRRWSAPTANRRLSPMPSSNGWPPPASGSHPSWRSTNTSRGAGSKTSSPTAKTSSAPSSPGPGAIPLPPSGRDENNRPILASGGPVWDPQGWCIPESEDSRRPASPKRWRRGIRCGIRRAPRPSFSPQRESRAHSLRRHAYGNGETPGVGKPWTPERPQTTKRTLDSRCRENRGRVSDNRNTLAYHLT